MEINDITARSREELYDECCDLRLPVSPKDSLETLEGFLNAVYDESPDVDSLVKEEEFEKDPIYIGKYPRLKVILNKILPF